MMDVLLPEHFILYVVILNVALLLFALFVILKYQVSTIIKFILLTISIFIPVIGSIMVLLWIFIKKGKRANNF